MFQSSFEMVRDVRGSLNKMRLEWKITLEGSSD